MVRPSKRLLSEDDITQPGPLKDAFNSVQSMASDFDNRLDVVEAATGTQYGNVPTLTNVTEIPTDVSGRIDLVYTEPTTVTMDAPGLTDLVLSIEGFEHVTWEGVAVHGTPDVSGVVWASAMWRDRDSTWHLLCEQDPSQGGGGGGTQITTGAYTAGTYAPVGEADWVASQVLGESNPRPARTVAANGTVAHELRPTLPQALLDAAPTYGDATFPHGLTPIFDMDTGATLWRPTNYGGANPPTARNNAISLGLVMLEYGTIATPGGQGYRFTVNQLTDFDFEARTVTVGGILEITENPLSFGTTSTSTLVGLSNPGILPTVQGMKWRSSIEFQIPGQPDVFRLNLMGNDDTGSLKVGFGINGSSLPNPIPAPSVDEDGFAIHRIEVTDQQRSLTIYS